MFYQYYAYVDDEVKRAADRIFIDNKLRVYFKGDYTKEGSTYMIVFCKVRKSDVQRFESCLDILADYYGDDYLEFCDWFEQMQKQYKENGLKM